MPTGERSVFSLHASLLCALLCAAPAGAAGFDPLFPDFLDLQNRAMITPVTGGDLYRGTSPDGLMPGEVSLSAGGLYYQHRIAELPAHPVQEDLLATLTGAWGVGDRLTVGGTLPYLLRNRKGTDSGPLDLALFGRYRFAGERARGIRWGTELLLDLPTGKKGDPPNSFTFDTTAFRLRILGALTEGTWELGGNLGLQGYGRSASGEREWDLMGSGYVTRSLDPRWKLLAEYAATRHYSGKSRYDDDSLLLGARYAWTPRVAVQAMVGTGLLSRDETWRVAGNLAYSWGGAPVPSGDAPAAAPTPAPAPPPPVEPLPKMAASPPLPAVASTASPLPAPKVRPSLPISSTPRLRIEVANRSGIPGLGRKVADFLHLQGFPVAFVDDSTLYVRDTTYVYYAQGMDRTAVEISHKIRRNQEVEMSPFPLSEIEILIVVGTDLAD